MKIYTLKPFAHFTELKKSPQRFYVLTKNDGRIVDITPSEEDDPTRYYSCVAHLIDEAKTLKKIVSDTVIKDICFGSLELVAEFESIPELEKEYPELLI